MALPQTRALTDAEGFRWTVTVDRGYLVIRSADGEIEVEFADPAELRSLAPQLTRAVTEHALDQQLAAAKASVDRRLARQRRGEPTGLRHRPVIDTPQPPAHRSLLEPTP
jgi:hypothetical protein